jgi:hypothetical protein
MVAIPILSDRLHAQQRGHPAVEIVEWWFVLFVLLDEVEIYNQ